MKKPNTKRNRREIYAAMLTQFETTLEKNDWIGFCWALDTSVSYVEGVKIRDLEELIKYKPKHNLDDSFWFDRYDMAKRMNILKTIIAQIDAEPKEWYERAKDWVNQHISRINLN